MEGSPATVTEVVVLGGLGRLLVVEVLGVDAPPDAGAGLFPLGLGDPLTGRVMRPGLGLTYSASADPCHPAKGVELTSGWQ